MNAKRDPWIIRAGEHDDLPTILFGTRVLLAQDDGQPKLPEGVAAWTAAVLDRPGPWEYLVAQAEDGRVAGFILLSRRPSDFHAASYVHLETVVTLPRFRQQGVYAALLDEIEAQARREGVVELHLFVGKNNAEGFAAHTKVGFEVADYTLMRKVL